MVTLRVGSVESRNIRVRRINGRRWDELKDGGVDDENDASDDETDGEVNQEYNSWKEKENWDGNKPDQ